MKEKWEGTLKEEEEGGSHRHQEGREVLLKMGGRHEDLQR